MPISITIFCTLEQPFKGQAYLCESDIAYSSVFLLRSVKLKVGRTTESDDVNVTDLTHSNINSSSKFIVCSSLSDIVLSGPRSRTN